MARRVIRKPVAARFTALCLLIGYAPLPKYGTSYDATLHAFFLGFVVSMFFGHAPITLPAVMDLSLPFRPAFYVHILLLHMALVLRVTGDLLRNRNFTAGAARSARWPWGRFVVSSVTAVIGRAFSGIMNSRRGLLL